MIERIRTWLRDWLNGSTALTPAALPDPEPPAGMQIGFAAEWEARRTGRPVKPLAQVFAPAKPMPGQLPAGMAMDSVPAAFTGNGALAQWSLMEAFNEGLAFLGYQYLAQLAQRAEYRRPAEIIAEHCTRKWIKLRGPDEAKLKAIEDFMGEASGGLNVRACVREAIEHDGLFGRSQIFLDFDDADDPAEMAAPLLFDGAKISKARPIKRVKVMEPMWSYPGNYDSTNPLRSDFYQPREWYVYGMTVSATRLLTFVSREVPDLLKPAYAFGGLSLTQMMKPYVDNWLSTRQSVNDLVQAFSQMVLATDTSSLMSDGGMLFKRVDLFNQTRNNRGTMVISKDEETLENIAVPLSGLEGLQAQAQEHMAAVTGIPLVTLLGITPSGLNASSDGEIRTFYAAIKAMQEKIIAPNLRVILDVVQLSLFGVIDPAIKFEFPDLWEMDAKDLAAIRKSDADADNAYVNNGVVSNEEVRERLSNDETGLYHGVDLTGPSPEPETDHDNSEDNTDDGH